MTSYKKTQSSGKKKQDNQLNVEPTGSDLRTVGVSPSDIEGDVEMGDAVAGDEAAGSRSSNGRRTS